MLSMTGFGSGEATAGAVTVTVELRSVNHRFLDASLKLPSCLAFLEIELRARLKEALARGRVTCQAQVALAADAAAPSLDPDRVDAVIKALSEVAARLEAQTGRPQELTLPALLGVPELFHVGQADPPQDDLREAFFGALEKALAGLVAMKEQEGAQLVGEMGQRIGTIRTRLDEVRDLAPRAAEEAHEKLRERLATLLEGEVDPQRLAQETAILADRANINEECERLGIHLHHFGEALHSGGQVAKRLNFLLQEMHREVNTMGSKTNLMDITRSVIAMKEEIESLREQVQNLE